MSKLTLINAMPHFTPIKCPICRESFKIGNGPWPAQPIEGDTRGAVKPVCLEYASIEEPDRDYGADWQIILDNIARGTFAEPDDVAIEKALERLEAEVERRG